MENTDGELWQQADTLFGSLMDQPAVRRRARLAEMDLDPELRRLVEKLLAAQEQTSGPLDRPLFSGETSALDRNALQGRSLGRWRLRDELGRGGSAVVYRAEREGDVQQEVAVKVFTLGALGALGAERFRREAQILARLSHPAITPLIDSGVCEDGTCWLAMPLVDGVRIDRCCEEQRLDTRATLRLFIRVCEAVAHAHRSLVIHRDLKPSNVLVDSGGQVHLLDFGISRFADDADERTHTFFRALTPDYAAPEQFRGAPPSTAMDVYGLGSLLYRLLAGAPPRQYAQQDPAPITRPSLAARASELGRRHLRPLRGDLDRVLLKALAEEPERRYLSVEALAEDLRSWLEGRPIQARRPALGYRVRKFVSRNKAGVAAAAGLMVALVLGISSTLLQAERANREAKRAIAVKDFLVDLFQASDPEINNGEIPTTEELLQRGIERIDTGLKGAPELAAEMRLILGNINRTLGRYQEAQPLIEAALDYAASDKTNSKLTGDALCAQGSLLQERGLQREAIPYFEQCRQHYLGTGQLTQELEMSLIDALYYSYSNAGLREEARSLAEEAVANPRLMRSEHALKVYFLRAKIEDDPLKAAEILQEALAETENRQTRIDDRIALHSELALALGRAGATEKAVVHRRIAFQMTQKVYPSGHVRIARQASNLASGLTAVGLYVEAEEYLRQALDIYRETGQGNTARAAAANNNLGRLLIDMDRPAEAVAYLRKAADWAEANFGEEDLRHAASLSNLSLALAASGKPDQSAQLWQRADTIYANSGQAHDWVRNTITGTRIALASGDSRAARLRLDKAGDLLRELNQPDSPMHIYLAAYGARIKALTADPADARAAFEAALVLTANSSDVHIHWQLLEAYGDYLHNQGDSASAIKRWRTAADVLKNLGQHGHPRVAVLSDKIGRG